MKFAPLGDSAVVVTLGDTMSDATWVRVRTLTAALAQAAAVGVVDVVPAYASVTIYYDIATAAAGEEGAYARICRVVSELVAKLEHSWPDLVRQKLGEQGEAAGREMELPVCYEGEFAPDLGEVARHCRLSPGEVVELHHNAGYLVQAIGFAPGFPYLGGLPEKLFTPRRPTPRLTVPAGSVGIGWMQTGIYPLSTPGGWQLIGRTPVALFRPREAEPALLRVGDRVKFRPITLQEFAAWK
jgi:inhibitor of KinA